MLCYLIRLAKIRVKTWFLMLDRPPEWILQPQIEPPPWFLQQVQRHVRASSGHYAAQLLWVMLALPPYISTAPKTL